MAAGRPSPGGAGEGPAESAGAALGPASQDGVAGKVHQRDGEAPLGETHWGISGSDKSQFLLFHFNNVYIYCITRLICIYHILFYFILVYAALTLLVHIFMYS